MADYVIDISDGSETHYFFDGERWISPSGDPAVVELLNRAAPYPGPSAGDPVWVMANQAARLIRGKVVNIPPRPKPKAGRVY